LAVVREVDGGGRFGGVWRWCSRGTLLFAHELVAEAYSAPLLVAVVFGLAVVAAPEVRRHRSIVIGLAVGIVTLFYTCVPQVRE
jgi:hypothetical protein